MYRAAQFLSTFYNKPFKFAFVTLIFIIRPGRHLGNTLRILQIIQNIIGQLTAMDAGLWQLWAMRAVNFFLKNLMAAMGHVNFHFTFNLT